MARVPVVSRTFKMTEVTVLCLNIETAEPFNQTVILPRHFKDEKKLMKEIEKRVNSESVKAVHVVDVKPTEKLLGMTEDEFIAHAYPITRSAAVTEEAE